MRNFIIVGGQRCGTTWLYKMLDSHPNIDMAKPLRPEPKFFLNLDRFSFEDYFEKYFSGNSNMLLGEKSTSYYESESALIDIKKFLPETKIIFIVRNPIDRAISNYNFSKANGLENRSLNDVFFNNIPAPDTDFLPSVNPFDYIKRGMYSTFIQKYIDVFGKGNVRVVCFEKIISSSGELADLFKFLGEDNTYQPEFYNEKVNETSSTVLIPQEIRAILKKIYEQEVISMSAFIDTSYWKDFRGKNDHF